MAFQQIGEQPFPQTVGMSDMRMVKQGSLDDSGFANITTRPSTRTGACFLHLECHCAASPGYSTIEARLLEHELPQHSCFMLPHLGSKQCLVPFAKPCAYAHGHANYVVI